MDLVDIIGGIIAVVVVCACLVLIAAIAIITIVLAVYAAVYTVALFHILFIEPVIFDTYSLFTIPYNQVWAIASMYPLYYWPLAALDIIGAYEGAFGRK